MERSNLDLCNYDFAFSMSPDSVWNYYLPVYVFSPMYPLLFEPKDADKLIAGKRKFCNFVYSRKKSRNLFNKYQGVACRNKLFHRLSEYKRVDSWGMAFNNMGRVLDRQESMPDFYRPYKFTIAFENAAHPGYVTEKLTNALAGGTVPIYWGGPSAQEQFNPKSFINCRDYDDWDAVIKRVIEVDNDDELYKQYLSEPAFVGNRKPEFLEESRIAERFEQIFNTQGKPREQRLLCRSRAGFRHFLRWSVRQGYKWLGTSDGY